VATIEGLVDELGDMGSPTVRLEFPEVGSFERAGVAKAE
jgi:hypothetical protein